MIKCEESMHNLKQALDANYEVPLWIAYSFKNGIDQFGIRIKVCYKKKLTPQINLPFNLLIQKYVFHDNPTWNINYSE